MNDITKATCKRLNKYKADPKIMVIGRLLERANMVYHDRAYSPADDLLKQSSMILRASATETFISTYVCGNFERRVCAGLASRYYEYISCFFTHGLDGVNLKKDANKFVRQLVADIESRKI